MLTAGSKAQRSQLAWSSAFCCSSNVSSACLQNTQKPHASRLPCNQSQLSCSKRCSSGALRCVQGTFSLSASARITGLRQIWRCGCACMGAWPAGPPAAPQPPPCTTPSKHANLLMLPLEVARSASRTQAELLRPRDNHGCDPEQVAAGANTESGTKKITPRSGHRGRLCKTPLCSRHLFAVTAQIKTS